MKNNKFIPLTVLAGLCILTVAMNNNQCNAVRGKCNSAPCSIGKKKQDDEMTKSTKENKKQNKKSRRSKKSQQQ